MRDDKGLFSSFSCPINTRGKFLLELWYYREHGEEVLLITIRILRGGAIPSELRSEATEEVGIAQPRRMRMVISNTSEPCSRYYHCN